MKLQKVRIKNIILVAALLFPIIVTPVDSNAESMRPRIERPEAPAPGLGLSACINAFRDPFCGGSFVGDDGITCQESIPGYVAWACDLGSLGN